MVNYDDEFGSILQNSGQLIPFFDSFFGFLYRRTDFFRVRDDSEPDSKFGFPEGSAEKILLSVFHRWQEHAENERSNSEKLSHSSVPPVAHEVEVLADEEGQPEVIPDVRLLQGSSRDRCPKSLPVSSAVHPDESETFNGADLGHYKWSQSSTDIDVTIPVDQTVTKGSHVKVVIQKDSVKVSTASGKVLLEGKLFASIKCSETVWNLTPGKQITLSLEKASEQWWSKFLMSDATELKPESLEIVQPLEQMSTRDKMAVEQALHRQHETELQNTQLESILRDAWYKDGSPFRGQPFDPSILNNVSK